MRGSDYSVSYSMAKSAVVGLTRSLGLQWAQYNIQCNAVAPVAVSESWQWVLDNCPQEYIDSILAENNMGRMGDPETDIAGVVIFLASSMSNYMTRRTLWADGGTYGEY